MGFWGKLGKGLLKVGKVAAPIALGMTGVGLPAAMAASAGLNALDKKVSGGSWKDALKSGLVGAGTGALGSVGGGALGGAIKGGGIGGFLKGMGTKLASNAIQGRLQGGTGGERPGIQDWQPGIMPSRIFGSNMGVEAGPNVPDYALNSPNYKPGNLNNFQKIMGTMNTAGNIAKMMGRSGGVGPSQNWMSPYMRGANQPRMPYSQTQAYQRMGVGTPTFGGQGNRATNMGYRSIYGMY